MYKTGPIVVIEDDPDDQEMLEEVFTNLGYPNDVMFFPDGETALEYLIDSNNKPFIVISDINLPRLNGLELREKIQNNAALNLRCIPYLFLTTGVSHRAVIDAYSKSVQGFFVKPTAYADLERMIDNIVKYWKDCTAPNYLE
jgi:CheY-like chemotaxis protein